MVSKIINELEKEFYELLEIIGLNFTQFAEVYFQTIMTSSNSPSYQELHDFKDRLKKRLSNKRCKSSPEYFAQLIHFIKHTYKTDNHFNYDDTKVAWKLYKNLKTRVTTIDLPADIGCEKSALTSIYEIFTDWRNSLELPSTKNFWNYSEPFMNEVLRLFLSKWHVKLNSKNRVEFRTDLKKIKIKATEFTLQIEKEFAFNSNKTNNFSQTNSK